MFAYHLFRAALILALCLPIYANTQQHCSDGFRQEAADKLRNITNCKKQNLGAEFAWNYSNNTRRLEILFGAKLDGEVGWLAWGLNPGKDAKMVGTRALIGIKLNNATVMHTYNITRSTKIGCALLPSAIDLEVHDFHFSYVNTTELHTIKATIILPQHYNDSHANVVWQVANAAKGKEPLMHPKNIQNLDCKETINLISGSVPGGGFYRRQKWRRVHGILNIVGWGTLLPLGAIIARYFRKFPVECPVWFRFHISCQILGYTLGTFGWIIGIWLGNESIRFGYHTHRILGIIIFTFATLQMLALRLKPTRNDDYRVYWNIYHHILGYTILTIISVNIFQGISILSAEHGWKWAYIGVLGLLGFTAVVLEIFTWIKFWLDQRKRRREAVSSGHSNNGQGAISGDQKGSPASHQDKNMASPSQPSAIRNSSTKVRDGWTQPFNESKVQEEQKMKLSP